MYLLYKFKIISISLANLNTQHFLFTTSHSQQNGNLSSTDPKRPPLTSIVWPYSQGSQGLRNPRTQSTITEVNYLENIRISVRHFLKATVFFRWLFFFWGGGSS